MYAVATEVVYTVAVWATLVWIVDVEVHTMIRVDPSTTLVSVTGQSEVRVV